MIKMKRKKMLRNKYWKIQKKKTAFTRNYLKMMMMKIIRTRRKILMINKKKKKACDNL